MLKRGEMLAKMIVIATNAHHGQFDKGGNPYILHPLAVMQLVESDDEEVLCMAVGHDLFEDTDVTMSYLTKEGISARVIDGIYAVTKLPGESYEEYKQRVLDSDDGMIVKKADLKHNSQLNRLKGVTEKDVARMGRYMLFYYEIVAEQAKNA